MAAERQDRKPLTLFFAGTDTDVGKTFTASLFAKRIHQMSIGGHCGKVGVYKPVASGCSRHDDRLVADDAVKLWQAAGRPRCLEEVCPQRFEAPLAPTQAAMREGESVDAGLLREGARCWESECDVLIVEGAGGLMSPLAEGLLNIDLAKQFEKVQLLIVAEDRLGAIHQTLATCRAAESESIQPAGIILCQVSSIADLTIERNRQEIERYTSVPVIGQIPHGATAPDVAFVDPWFTQIYVNR